ncbi:uncharacterized protein LOC111829535 [Capsella rubella]|uniref:uncharacterized protein LOC111829535 n=1 Tax=Capsella rubella TaxID=81985 RepID=UPI000CD4C6C3|nr:uncharacterized protein LOC111829535 [Capsella rubella]
MHSNSFPFLPTYNGILDYLEGFSIENLHKVYEVFSLLALSARASADSFRSSVSNELMMIVRKQVSHPDKVIKLLKLVGEMSLLWLETRTHPILWFLKFYTVSVRC